MARLPSNAIQQIRKIGASFPDWVRTYSFSDLRGDGIAGLTVGVMLVPQGMAYALLAGLPPIYGLYASLAPLVVYALLGTSRHLSIGTTAIDSLVMVFALSVLAPEGSQAFIQLAFLFAVMVGVVHLLMALGRLGFLVNLLSKPVITGFIAAAATIIGVNQLASLLGLNLPRADRVYTLLLDTTVHLGDTHLPSLAIGLGGIVLLLGLKRWNRFIPSALVLVVLTTFATWFFNLEAKGVKVVGAVPTGLPSLILPPIDWSAIPALVVPAITLALIQFTNVVSLGKSFAIRHGYAIRPNRELFAVGMANVVGSLFQGYTVSGSFSRTAVNEQAGAQTPLANIFTAGLIVLVLVFLTPLLYFLPVPTLAAIIMVAAFSMIRVKDVRQLYKVKPMDGHLALVTFLATLIFGLQVGILVGMGASVMAIMYRISRPNVAVLGNLPGTRSFRDITMYDEAIQIEGILILRVDASFSYANAEFLKDKLLSIGQSPEDNVHSVIIDASSVNDVDTTAVEALFSVLDSLDERGIELYFTGIHGGVDEMMTLSGLEDRLGPDRFFLSPYRAVTYIREKRIDNEISLPTPDAVSS